MSIKTDWENLLKLVEEDGTNEFKELKKLVFAINDSKENLSKDSIEKCEEELKKIYPVIEKMPDKEFKRLEKLFKTQILSLKRELEKKNSNSVTRWDLFNQEAKSHKDWECVTNLIDCINEMENEEITEEDIKKIEDSISSVDKFMQENATNFEREWAVREFKKKLKMFKNRINRAVEDDFGAWIKQLRLAQGYSLMDLQKITGVTASYIYRVESGSRKTPSLPIVNKLAVGLGVDPEEFLRKLNLSPDEKLGTFTELVTLNKFMIGEKVADNNIKSNIISIFSKIEEVAWTEESKFRDGMEILELIDKLKKSLK